MKKILLFLALTLSLPTQLMNAQQASMPWHKSWMIPAAIAGGAFLGYNTIKTMRNAHLHRKQKKAATQDIAANNKAIKEAEAKYARDLKELTTTYAPLRKQAHLLILPLSKGERTDFSVIARVAEKNYSSINPLFVAKYHPTTQDDIRKLQQHYDVVTHENRTTGTPCSHLRCDQAIVVGAKILDNIHNHEATITKEKDKMIAQAEAANRDLNSKTAALKLKVTHHAFLATMATAGIGLMYLLNKSPKKA